METADFINTLDREGRLLAAAAAEAGTDAKVPTCPDWQVSDLLRHTGMVHRWATAFVAEARTSYQPGEELPDLDDDDLLSWYREAHRRLVDTLTTAPPDVQCWQVLPAPSPLLCWARRQAHETTVHRVDAEAARGGSLTEIARDVALDGIDELLRGFHARRKSAVRTEEPRVLRVRVTDGGEVDDAGDADDAVWTVRLSAEPPVTERNDAGSADCELSGPAVRLYLSLWNRLPFPEVVGDGALADLWREKSGIVWS
ncbi:maleylpyruvate isomerase family mycothiol-dependent enzyme [Streptomyces chromofuscus]|uniref:Maleylpyruvate isomerase family mycothiol-dependent enzyme n=1 Tax=Streptomyces chromofuscus TaxID=42881 RepID=A0A7M2TAT8_STRCW|nr:maleylpyruvate isomerase family mycothiol-dependent enzyme [Streptomyces chromofuscus]QOV45229.1 maleylpyruvate isomerase family mycothiol-dependent enzyme [Streptomyces chromofuscus]GGS99316.1 hypothetical protein GCM10010254_19220 [Streptomyces chromofuscus]